MAAHAGTDALEAGLDEILQSPASDGIVDLIVRRPAEGEREVLEEGLLDVDDGLKGDRWRTRGSSSTEDGLAHPERQLTLMNSRVIALIAGDPERWPLAGDQLYVDLDLRPENLPTGTRLEVGSAVIEVTDQLHTGCAKFTERFGSAAIRFVNSPSGRALRLRGMYARVVEPGAVRPATRSGRFSRDRDVVEEARLEQNESGLAPATEGWFVVNVRDAAWLTHDVFGASCGFEGPEAEFKEFGIGLCVLQPGQPNGLYHGEETQENFLVLSGECLLLVEGEERRLQAWDFVHSPWNTEHIFVGASDGPCVILMAGTRRPGRPIFYPVSELALRHRAGVETETPNPREAYASYSDERVERPAYWAQLPWA